MIQNRINTHNQIRQSLSIEFHAPIHDEEDVESKSRRFHVFVVLQRCLQRNLLDGFEKLGLLRQISFVIELQPGFFQLLSAFKERSVTIEAIEND